MRPSVVLAIILAGATAAHAQLEPGEVTLRVALFEVGDIQTRELLAPDSPRLKRIAEVIQRIRPNVLLLSGIAFDAPGGPNVKPDSPPGQNGQRFADQYLALPQADGLAPLKFSSFAAPVNSGMASGMDLDHNGRIVTEFPEPGIPGTAEAAAAYSGDCWGAGAYPGQHAMALLVDDRLVIQTDAARTFRTMPWDYMLGSEIPRAEDAKEEVERASSFTNRERLLVRLSTSGHWDVPIKLPNGAVVHFLCSRPVALGTPLSTRRNHDEIRFWADYIEDAAYIVDDANHPGGISAGTSFVLLGNLGLAPDPKAGPDDVITTMLFGARGVNHSITPKSDLILPGLDAAATTFSNARTDYILPSRDLGIAQAGIWRHPPAGSPEFPSEHFPVWMDLVVPAPATPPAPPALKSDRKP